MIMDAFNSFEPLTGTAITASAASTNIIDLSVGRDMGGGHYPDPDLVVGCLTSFGASSASATLNIQVQGAPDNGSGSPGGYYTIQETGVMSLGQLAAGMRLLQMDLASISQAPLAAINTTFTCSSGASTITVASATGLAQGQQIAAAGYITPGTTISSISGTTVTLSANTIAAASTATAISFFARAPLPRFLRLNYVVANGPMTSGSIYAGAALDVDQLPQYAAGYTFPSGT